jgi:hypothetical protein
MAPPKGGAKRTTKNLAAKKGTRGKVSKERAMDKHAAQERADAAQERKTRKLLSDIAELAETDPDAAFTKYEDEIGREAAPWAFTEFSEGERKRSFMLQAQSIKAKNKGVPSNKQQYFLNAIAVYGTIDFAFLSSEVL